MKNSYSKVIVSGIITSIDFNSDISEVMRPVAKMIVYDQETNEWVDNIYIIFTDNGSVQQFKGFNVGTILLVTGELKYQSGVGYSILVNHFTVFEKNKEKSNIQIQKVFYFSNLIMENFVYIQGTKIYQNGNIVSICKFTKKYYIICFNLNSIRNGNRLYRLFLYFSTNVFC